MAQNRTKSGTFSDQIFVHFGSASQLFSKSDMKNSCICSIWGPTWPNLCLFWHSWGVREKTSDEPSPGGTTWLTQLLLWTIWKEQKCVAFSLLLRATQICHFKYFFIHPFGNYTNAIEHLCLEKEKDGYIIVFDTRQTKGANNIFTHYIT